MPLHVKWHCIVRFKYSKGCAIRFGVEKVKPLQIYNFMYRVKRYHNYVNDATKTVPICKFSYRSVFGLEFSKSDVSVRNVCENGRI